VTGTFWGTARNLTAGITADFGILVYEHQGLLQGCLGVKAPLYGSGPLQGSVQGDVVQFDVTAPSVFLHFDGRKSDEGLAGTYSAFPQGGSQQSGDFSLERQPLKRSIKNFNPQTDCPTDAEMNR